jgi:hypothetical protein
MLVALMLLPAAAGAQESPPTSAHWAYSAYFGTGWYRVSGDRNVFIVHMTPRWSWSEPSLDGDGKRSMGLHFKAPVSIGLDQFDYYDIPGAVDIDNLSFLSVNPGIDIEIPINSIWSLRPYASLGYGGALNSSDSAWTYWAGVKSRVSFRYGKLNWQLLNQVGFVGYTPNEGPDDEIWPVMAGLEFDYPVGAPTADGDQLLLHWRAAYTVFEDDLDFARGYTVVRSITDQWEIGIAIARRDSQIPVWFLEFDMLGLGYRASSDGELKALTFLFRSMFDL